MDREARVGQIYVAPSGGEPMISLDQVRAVRHQGLEGDRYFLGNGFWQKVKNPRETVRCVTLISEQAILDARDEYGQDFDPMMTRRNLVISGDVDLMSFVGVLFLVGEVMMGGVEECMPCNRPSTLSGIKGFEKAFKANGRAGIRAQILFNGLIRVGDKVVRSDDSDSMTLGEE